MKVTFEYCLSQRAGDPLQASSLLTMFTLTGVASTLEREIDINIRQYLKELCPNIMN